MIEKTLERQGLRKRRSDRPCRRGRLPAADPARWSALPHADPVCRPHGAAGDHLTGKDRLYLRPGWQTTQPGQVLASNASVQDFQDVEGFLKNGGQRGPQRRILREGTYAFNLVQFIVVTEERIYALPSARRKRTPSAAWLK